MENQVKVEVCCDTLQSALNAQQAGAHRVELCSAYSLGGITPSYGLIEQARKRLKIDINALIRPREGDFLYEPEEVAVMISDIQACAKMGVNGVVIGALDPFGNIDMDSSRAMVAVAKHLGLSVTFHRAIDRSNDIMNALENIISLGADRVLTSGGFSSALEGVDVIAQMNRLACGRIIVMPGSKVNFENAKELVDRTGVHEVHLSAREEIHSSMIYRAEAFSSISHYTIDPYMRGESSVKKIKSTIEILNETKM